MPWCSSALTDEIALPTFRASSSASSLRFASMASASACRRRERSVGGVFAHGPESAVRAAATARSTSASPAMAARASGSPVAGSARSRTSPEAGSRSSPSMKRPYSRPVATAMARTIPSESAAPPQPKTSCGELGTLPSHQGSDPDGGAADSASVQRVSAVDEPAHFLDAQGQTLTAAPRIRPLCSEILREQLLREQPPEAAEVGTDEGGAESATVGVRARVGPPGRIRDEGDGLRGAVLRDQGPTSDVLAHLVEAGAALVHEQRRVGRDVSERLARLENGAGKIGIELYAGGAQVLGGDPLDAAGPEQHVGPDGRDPLRDERLGRADEDDRLLEPPALADEQRLLADALGVVARIGLVRDQLAEERGRLGQVGANRDPAAQTAEVVVERRPRHLGDELDLNALALRQAELGRGHVAQVGDDGEQRVLQHVRGHRIALAPRLVALGERPRAGQNAVERLVRRRELVLGDEARPHPVAALDLVRERDRLAGQAP